jgi:Zn finger protein HypA/HybF involved in hydrogenase expression
MHEHGLMNRLLDAATRESAARGAALVGITVRLGALSSSDPAHFRHEFEHVCEERGLGAISLQIECDSERPSGVELVSVDLAGP